MPAGPLSAPPPAAASRTGWLCKLPSRGDFVAGGGSRELVEGLRSWSLSGLARLREGGGPAEDGFLTAPFWRFAARAGAFGAPGGIGVIGPGADSAGRLFPVIVAAERAQLGPGAALDAALDAAGPWFERVEAALFAALHPDADPAALALALPPPPALPGDADAQDRRPAPTLGERAPNPARRPDDAPDAQGLGLPPAPALSAPPETGLGFDPADDPMRKPAAAPAGAAVVPRAPPPAPGAIADEDPAGAAVLLRSDAGGLAIRGTPGAADFLALFGAAAEVERQDPSWP